MPDDSMTSTNTPTDDLMTAARSVSGAAYGTGYKRLLVLLLLLLSVW